MRSVVEDPDFVVAATCSQHGMGSWEEVWRFSEVERLAFYYSVARTEGYDVNWSTGAVFRR